MLVVDSCIFNRGAGTNRCLPLKVDFPFAVSGVWHHALHAAFYARTHRGGDVVESKCFVFNDLYNCFSRAAASRFVCQERSIALGL